MPAKKAAVPFDLASAMLAAFDTNDRINHYLIRNLPVEAWRASPPNGKGRSIAKMVGHLHNVRLMWLKAAAGSTGKLAKLEEDKFDAEEAIGALSASAAALRELLEAALQGEGKIKGFKPDVASFFAYLLAHDAHHRGQISMLARQVGHPLPQGAMFGLWEWGTR